MSDPRSTKNQHHTFISGIDSFSVMQLFIEKIMSNIISIDGKTIRNSGKNKSLQ